MLESERWVRMQQLTDGQPAPACDLALTWWHGSRQEFDQSPNVIQLLTTAPTTYWVAEFTVGGRPLFAEFLERPDVPLGALQLVGWPELGGVVAVEGGGTRVVALPVTHTRPHGLTACD